MYLPTHNMVQLQTMYVKTLYKKYLQAHCKFYDILKIIFF